MIVPPQAPPVRRVSPSHVTVTAPQLSDAATSPVFAGGTLARQSTVTDPGHAIDGGVLSSTVIVCVQSAKFPQASVARYVRVIDPPQAPLSALSPCHVTVTKPQLSVAVTRPVFATGTSATHSTVTGPGQVIDGGVLSSTVIVCVQSAKFPHASVARYVRTMVPPQAPPERAVSPSQLTVTAPQLSDAVTSPVFAGGTLARQSTVTGPGHPIDGGVLSSTVIV